MEAKIWPYQMSRYSRCCSASNMRSRVMARQKRNGCKAFRGDGASSGAGGGIVSGPSTAAGQPRPASPRGATPPPVSVATADGPGAGLTDPGEPDVPQPRIFVSRGDRRADLDVYAAQIIERAGLHEARLALEIEYDPERDLTRIFIDPSSVEWPRRLTWLRGWRRANS
jgi:hypothetical protein